MSRWKSMLMLAMTAAALTGCASSKVDGIEELVAEPEQARPTFSISTTRTIPPPAVAPDGDVVDPAVVEAPAAPSAGETGVTFYRFKVGDPVIIHLRGIYPRDEQIEDIVDEDGKVTIPLVGDIPAAGKSTSQLESDIRSLYIDGGYYRSITVNVVMPSQTYFIRGEVRGPGRYQLLSGVTIMQAIAAAGGYTEFASQRSVKLIRGTNIIPVNMKSIERNPDQDIRLESGDVIVVDRSIL